MPKETRFRREVQHRHLTVYDDFVAQFHRAARELAELQGDSRLASLTVSARQFDRWMGGDLRRLKLPRGPGHLETGT